MTAQRPEGSGAWSRPCRGRRQRSDQRGAERGRQRSDRRGSGAWSQPVDVPKGRPRRPARSRAPSRPRRTALRPWFGRWPGRLLDHVERARGSSDRSRQKPVTPSTTSSGAAPQLVVTTGVPRHRFDHDEPNGSGQRIGKSMARAYEQRDLGRMRHVLEQLDVVTEQGLISCSKYENRPARHASGSS